MVDMDTSNHSEKGDHARRDLDKPPSKRFDYEYSANDLKGDQFNEEELERIDNLEKATTNVWKVLRKYGNASLPSLDPNTVGDRGWKIENDNPWCDVRVAIKEIVTAGEGLTQAWGDGAGNGKKEESITCPDSHNEQWWEPLLSSDSSKKNDTSGNARSQQTQQVHSATLSAEEQSQFEQIHMDWATNAFADELEALRNGQLEKQFGVNVGKNIMGGDSAAVDNMLDLDPNEHSFIVAKRNKTRDEDRFVMEEVDVQILADMLRSGNNVFSEEDKNMLLRAKLRGEKMYERVLEKKEKKEEKDEEEEEEEKEEEKEKKQE
ncbi:hypothetical protein ACHAW6_011642 [Cyclotella cf. meneghiniana]